VQADFWHERWQNNRIGFHSSEINPLLMQYIDALQLQPQQRIFVPLCGKTLDIGWLRERGYQVVGVELSEIAVQLLFEQLGHVPDISTVGNLKRYQAPELEIYVGDFFELSADQLGETNATFDRAALIALPEAMRKRYVEHLIDITRYTPQLLITLSYDQNQMNGPPFSVTTEEVHQHYNQQYQLENPLTQKARVGKNDDLEVTESVWLLK